MDNFRNVDLDEYLQEALISQRKRIDIALLLFANGRQDLMATQIEDIHFHSQAILDKYCVIE